MAGSDGRLLILCYHAVSETWPSEGAIAPRRLARQLRYLLRRGYRPRTLSEALREPASQRTLVVTFDDAYRSVAARGREVLERLGVPGTLFVPTDSVAEGGPMTWSTLGRWVGTEHEEELRCMTWEEVRGLAESGWEVGSHTCSHPRLTELPAAAVADEMSRSRRACEEALQRPCPSLAYPFGAHDRHVVGAAREAGYAHAVTLAGRLLEPIVAERPLELSRDGVFRSTRWPEFALATAPSLRRLRARRKPSA